MTERIRWAGDRAFLVEFASLAEVMAFSARAEFGQLDGVPAARTVLLTFEAPLHARRAAERVRGVDLAPLPSSERRRVDLDVVYDGGDLAEVAALSGLSPEQVVAAHTGTDWIAAFGGFAPGFVYLTGGDPRLAVPRRDAPRTAVPAGSVALAGEFSAVYPGRSPGGWRLIGRTDAPLWRLDRDPPSLIAPGDAVRFRAVRATATGATGGDAVPGRASPRLATDPAPPALEIIAPGPLALIQDRGRPGHAALGVTGAGAADAASARQANRLVGNAREAALIECTLGGLTVRAVGDQVLALTGAVAAATVRAGADEGEPLSPGSAFLLRDGETLEVGPPAVGLRTYLAVRGGIDAPETLGSRSADRLSGLGPRPLQAGDLLPVGNLAESAVGAPEPGLIETPPTDGAVEVSIRFGPRDDWFDADERERFLETTWVVGAQSDRVGLRLEPATGFRPLRVRAGDLPSEGLVAGAVQIPPSGEPVLFGADHPVTGGYPVIAVVERPELSCVAQLRPGDRIRFVERRAEW